jgi:hypothetical protein
MLIICITATEKYAPPIFISNRAKITPESMLHASVEVVAYVKAEG